jgi:hypothetical protein
MDQSLIATALVKGRSGSEGCQEGAMAARSGRPSMSLFSLTDAAVGWLGSRECVVRSSLSGAYSSIFFVFIASYFTSARPIDDIVSSGQILIWIYTFCRCTNMNGIEFYFGIQFGMMFQINY